MSWSDTQFNSRRVIHFLYQSAANPVMCLLSGLGTNLLHIFLFNHACQLLVLLGRGSACFVFTLPLFPVLLHLSIAKTSTLHVLSDSDFRGNYTDRWMDSPSLFSFSLSRFFFLYQLSVMWGTSNHLLTDMSASRSFSRSFYSAPFVRPVTTATHCCPCFPLNRSEWISFRGLNRQSMSLGPT